MVAGAEERPLGGVQRRSIGRVRRETPRCSSHALPLNALSARPKVFRPSTFLQPLMLPVVRLNPNPVVGTLPVRGKARIGQECASIRIQSYGRCQVEAKLASGNVGSEVPR